MSRRAVQVVLALSVVLMVTGIILKVTGDGGVDTAGTVAGNELRVRADEEARSAQR